MEAGLTSALSRAPDAPIAVLETDEKYIPAMVKATNPKVVVLLNLSRDQMDRAAEIWLLARRWREALAAAPGLPGGRQRRRPAGRLGGELGRGRSPGWPPGSAGAKTPGAARTAAPTCSRDGDDWACGECGGRRPPVSWMLSGDQVIDPSGRATPLDLQLPGRANRSNAVIALAVAEAFGVHITQALRELRAVTSVAGRYTQVNRRGCDDPAAARQEPGRLARGARRARAGRRRPSCWR